jgi:hypothetical protein
MGLDMNRLNYHDVVRIVESHRPHSVKMVQTEEMRILEPVLNKIRFALRELRKEQKIRIKNVPEVDILSKAEILYQPPKMSIADIFPQTKK